MRLVEIQCGATGKYKTIYYDSNGNISFNNGNIDVTPIENFNGNYAWSVTIPVGSTKVLGMSFNSVLSNGSNVAVFATRSKRSNMFYNEDGTTHDTGSDGFVPGSTYICKSDTPIVENTKITKMFAVLFFEREFN